MFILGLVMSGLLLGLVAGMAFSESWRGFIVRFVVFLAAYGLYLGGIYCITLGY